MVSIRSTLQEAQLAEIDALAAAIRDSMGTPEALTAAPAAQDPKALFALSYGLFVVTVKDGGRDNGCITNTVSQIASQPNRIALSVNKMNLTHDMLLKTGVFNVSVLSEDATFDVFTHFGFQSGRDTDKFAGYQHAARSENGLYYLTDMANALLSAKLVQAIDCGSHTLFLADVTASRVLSDRPSATYAYYFAHIKPKPQPQEQQRKGWVCSICGYVYEGDPLPADFICPLCKHGAEDFEPLR